MTTPTTTVTLTRAALDALPEYSCSLPTGTTIGKRWKRDANAYRPPVVTDVCGLRFVFPWPAEWWMGEYREAADPAMVLIRWSRVVVSPAPSVRQGDSLRCNE